MRRRALDVEDLGPFALGLVVAAFAMVNGVEPLQVSAIGLLLMIAWRRLR